MIKAAINLYRKMCTSAGAANKHFAGIARLRAYPVNESGEFDDVWERRVIALCDGRLITEVVSTLYREEITNGAGTTGLGLLHRAFESSVINIINGLVDTGYIRLHYDEESRKEGDVPDRHRGERQ